VLLLLPLSCLFKQTPAGARSKRASTATSYETVVWQRRVCLVNTEMGHGWQRVGYGEGKERGTFYSRNGLG
jgi:hypothetical protein